MARASAAKKNRPRAFQFRGGVRISGTVLACDAAAAAELVFISHAAAWPVATGGAAQRRNRQSRVQILTTTETLTLMGSDGERLRSRALMPGYGRPFALGFLRLELIPAGHHLGSASLLCDTGGRRILYASTVGVGISGGGFAARELRSCDAVCIDATFADPRFVFPPPAVSDARLVEAAAEARSADQRVAVLVSPRGAALHAARALHSAGWALRADRAIVDALALYASCGIEVPPVARFAGKLSSSEILLWSFGSMGLPGSLATPTPERAVRPASWARLGAALCVVWMSEWAGDVALVRRLGVDVAIPASRQADFDGIVEYVRASGAREVATLHPPSDALRMALHSRNMDIYALGPPRQIGLFDSRK
jgi:putative mRNA 3-end processing factor